MAVPRLAMRSAGCRIRGAGRCACLLAAALAVAAPSSASAAPSAESLQGATSSTAATTDAGSGRAAAAVPAVRQTADTTVQRVAATEPVRTALDAVRPPVEQAPDVPLDTPRSVISPVTPGQAPAVASTDGAGAALSPDGGIHRATTRHGAAADGAGGTVATTLGSIVDAPLAALNTGATPARPESAASSAAARSGDDSPGPFPFQAPTGTDVFGGPAGVALLGLAILAGLALLAPRFRSRLLHMAPARRGLAAFLTPIERPG